jgi:hypothetical protein
MKTLIEEEEEDFNKINNNSKNNLNNGTIKNWVSFNKLEGNDGGNILLNSSKMAAASSSFSDRQQPKGFFCIK